MRLLALGLVLIVPAANAALVTYDYRGTDYTYIATEQPTETNDGREFGNPWFDRTQNYVTGWITIDTDFLPGGSLKNVSVDDYWNDPDACPDDNPGCATPSVLHAWSFFDGVFTNGHPAGENEFFNGGFVRFTTDNAGNFLSWNFNLIGDPEALIIRNGGDIRLFLDCTDSEGDQKCANSSRSGTWTRRQVPEPGALVLAMGGLLLAKRRART
jgi:hypothetical protein